MANRATKLKSVKISYRLSEAAAAAVELLAERTGWSAAKAASFMLELAARVAWHTEHSDPVTLKTLREFRALVRAAGDAQNVRAKAAASIRAAAAREVAARKAVSAVGVK